MAEVFFSYKAADRERVRRVRDSLVTEGFDVFWDQEVPSGVDWDTWIRQKLTQSQCVLVFWSKDSIASDNVRHEATVAKQQGKLISVLLEPITAEQFPMGLYTHQAVNLADWESDPDRAEWNKLRREIQAKLTPLWVKRQVAELEAELVAERTRREGAEVRDKAWQAQIVKEAQTHEDLQRERDKAVDEVTALTAMVDELKRARSETEGHAAELVQRLTDTEAQRVAITEELKRVRSEMDGRVAELSQRLTDTEAQRVTTAKQTEAAIGRATVAESKLQTLQPELETLRGRISKAYEAGKEKTGSIVLRRFLQTIFSVIGLLILIVGWNSAATSVGQMVVTVIGGVFLFLAIAIYWAFRPRSEAETRPPPS